MNIRTQHIVFSICFDGFALVQWKESSKINLFIFFNYETHSFVWLNNVTISIKL